MVTRATGHRGVDDDEDEDEGEVVEEENEKERERGELARRRKWLREWKVEEDALGAKEKREWWLLWRLSGVVAADFAAIVVRSVCLCRERMKCVCIYIYIEREREIVSLGLKGRRQRRELDKGDAGRIYQSKAL